MHCAPQPAQPMSFLAMVSSPWAYTQHQAVNGRMAADKAVEVNRRVNGWRGLATATLQVADATRRASHSSRAHYVLCIQVERCQMGGSTWGTLGVWTQVSRG